MFLGRITKDPELRRTNAGTAYCRFTLAVNRMKTQDGKETADFIPCVCWTKTAENLAQYVIKGQQLLVQGRLQSGSYEDNSGNTHYTLEINAFRIEFLQNPGQQRKIRQILQIMMIFILCQLKMTSLFNN